MSKYCIFCPNPKTNKLQEARIYMTKDATLETLLQDAHSHLKLKVENLPNVERCRLVLYNNYKQSITRSFEGQEKKELCQLLKSYEPLEMMLESRTENEQFEPIPEGSELVRVFTVDLETADIDGPILIRAMVTGTVLEFRELLSKRLEIPLDMLSAATLRSSRGCYLSIDEAILSTEDVSFSLLTIVFDRQCFKCMCLTCLGEKQKQYLRYIIGQHRRQRAEN